MASPGSNARPRVSRFTKVYHYRLLAEDDTIVFQVGTHTNTISMKYADFARLVNPTVVEFARHSKDI